MISITNSKETITICKVESIELNLTDHEFIINGYVMEQQRKTELEDKERSKFDTNMYILRDRILDILHNKSKGRYKITEDLNIIKIN